MRYRPAMSKREASNVLTHDNWEDEEEEEEASLT